MAAPTNTATGLKQGIITLGANENIIAQGAQAEYIYIVMSGRVNLLRDGAWLTTVSTQSVLGSEGAYNRTGVYPYTARTETICRLARYHTSDFLEDLYRTPRLCEVTFGSLARQLDMAWEKIIQSLAGGRDAVFGGDIQTFEPGDWIIREGEETADIFRIISSQLGLEVSKDGQVLAVIKEPGEIFGEMASLLQEKRTASVRSIGQSVLEVYPPQQIMELLRDYSDLSLRIIKTLSRRLAETSQALADVKKDTPA